MSDTSTNDVEEQLDALKCFVGNRLSVNFENLFLTYSMLFSLLNKMNECECTHEKCGKIVDNCLNASRDYFIAVNNALLIDLAYSGNIPEHYKKDILDAEQKTLDFLDAASTCEDYNEVLHSYMVALYEHDIKRVRALIDNFNKDKEDGHIKP